MSSNENDAMERNDVLVESNMLIYYMPKSELRMQRYEATNMSTWISNFGDSENYTAGKVKPGRSGTGRRDPDLDRAFGSGEWWI